MSSLDWFAGIIWVSVVIGAYLVAMWFNPEKSNRHK